MHNLFYMFFTAAEEVSEVHRTRREKTTTRTSSAAADSNYKKLQLWAEEVVVASRKPRTRDIPFFFA